MAVPVPGSDDRGPVYRGFQPVRGEAAKVPSIRRQAVGFTRRCTMAVRTLLTLWFSRPELGLAARSLAWARAAKCREYLERFEDKTG